MSDKTRLCFACLKVGCENIRGFYGKDPDFDFACYPLCTLGNECNVSKQHNWGCKIESICFSETSLRTYL